MNIEEKKNLIVAEFEELSISQEHISSLAEFLHFSDVPAHETFRSSLRRVRRWLKPILSANQEISAADLALDTNKLFEKFDATSKSTVSVGELLALHAAFLDISK